MQFREALRATRQWAPFAAKTIAFGSMSLMLGPLTRDRRASLYAMQRWCKSSVKGLDIEVAASGLENVPKSGPFIYCSNHQSIVDIIVLGSVLPHDYKWAAKRSLMKIPFLGWHLQLAGHVPVDRGKGPRAASEVITRFARVLKDGKPLLVFPEGTRSETGVLQPFKNGSFYAAVRAGVPVVPVAIEGTHKLMKKGAFDTGDGSMRVVHLKIGKPTHPSVGMKEKLSVPDLRHRTHTAMSELVRSLGGKVADLETGSGYADDFVLAEAAE